MSKVYDRGKKTYYNEQQYGRKRLKFLYGSLVGRMLLKIAISSGFSSLNERLNSSKRSTRKIQPFIEKYNIKMDDFKSEKYKNFNDFFTRKLAEGKRKICSSYQCLISPADSKLLVYTINKDLILRIKNTKYSIKELLKNDVLAEEFRGGLCLVFRLSMDDLHRYCFVESGDIIEKKSISGKLHTVSSISSKYKVFTENKREYTVIRTSILGEIIQMEIGALLVGKINNHDTIFAKKGREKGYFSLGGSTIVVLISRGKTKVDSDILKNSEKGIETKVKYGEKIGEIYAKTPEHLFQRDVSDNS